MKIRSERGFTVVDIAISIIIITMFVSIIAVVISRFNSSAKEIQYKEEATEIAIEEIEKIKKEGFELYKKRSIANGNSKILEDEPIEEKEGFYKTITIVDYTDMEDNDKKISKLVKKATVTISYIYKGEEQTVELSTILSKEN